MLFIPVILKRNVLTVTFDPFNAYLLNKMIDFLKKKKMIRTPNHL